MEPAGNYCPEEKMAQHDLFNNILPWSQSHDFPPCVKSWEVNKIQKHWKQENKGVFNYTRRSNKAINLWQLTLWYELAAYMRHNIAYASYI